VYVESPVEYCCRSTLQYLAYLTPCLIYQNIFRWLDISITWLVSQDALQSLINDLHFILLKTFINSLNYPGILNEIQL